jgi:hypothetical protein
VQVRVLLNSKAQSNIIIECLAKLLKLPQYIIDISVKTLNRFEMHAKYSIRAQIFLQCTNYTESVEFLIIPSICNQLVNKYIDKQSVTVPHKTPLTESDFYKPREMDALIVVELFYQLIGIVQEIIMEFTVLWQKTKLEWILAGKVNSFNKTSKITKCMLSFNALQKSINKFYDIEEIQEQKFLSDEEFKVEQYFKQNTVGDSETGRYTISFLCNDKILYFWGWHKTVERQIYRLEK